MSALRFWFFVLGAPLAVLGLAVCVATAKVRAALVAFPRSKACAYVLCAVGWFWTASACDRLGIEVFDKFLKVFPGELWILAAVLTVLTCWWMANLLPIRGLCAILMLFPGEMFPAIRLCDTSWRLTLVVFAYACAIVGMFGMFYPWRVRQALTWWAGQPSRVRKAGVASLALGVLYAVLGVCVG